jgi:hypothetical protein
MSALDKNRQALLALVKNAALVERLMGSRVAVVSSGDERSAQLLGDVLADCLARLWPNIDFSGPLAERQLGVATSAARSGLSPESGLRQGWNPPYDAAISIECDAPAGSATWQLRVAAQGWEAYLGEEGTCSDDPNPVGPAFAAALAASQLFGRLFANELADLEPDVIGSLTFDARQICGEHQLSPVPLDLGETVFFGCGAVTHGMVWLLENWHMEVTGAPTVVDPDPYGASNGQRYAFMHPVEGEVQKVEAIQARLRQRHPNLDVRARRMGTNEFCLERGFDTVIQRAVTGLDSGEARRQAALKLPVRTINMWTEGHRAGASRYAPDGQAACLACDYLEDFEAAMDETARVQLETSLAPHEVRRLLDSPILLTRAQAQAIGAHRQVSGDQFVGQPLRSVLPLLCATAPIKMPGDPASTDVPFAFSSLLAGICGFMMLLADQKRPAESVGWSQHVFKTPTAYMRQDRYRRDRCVCCDMVYVR